MKNYSLIECTNCNKNNMKCSNNIVTGEGESAQWQTIFNQILGLAQIMYKHILYCTIVVIRK